jgi:outer membrane receptor protein involved in Fe transport
VLSLSRSEQKSVFAGDRSLTDASAYGCDQLLSNYPSSDPNHLAVPTCGSTFTAFGRFFGAGLYGGGVTLDNSFHDSGNGSGNPADATVTAPGGGRYASDFVHFNALDRYNFAPVNYLQQPAIRNNVFGSGRFQITDNVSAYAQVSYTQRQSSQQLAQVPTSLSSSGGFGPQWAFGVTPDNVFNPFGTQISGTFFRNVAVGPRHNNYDFNTLASTAGLQGSFQLGDRNFDWEIYGQYNSSRSTKIGLNYINLFNLRKALGPSFRDAGGLHCGAPGAVIDGCVPFNVFGGPDLGLGAGIISQAEYDAMVNYISYTETQANGDKGINYGANISGEIAPLQGGMLSFAAGLESRRERFFNQPDALVSSGGSSDNFVLPTKGQTKIDEAYIELDAPILKDLPGAQELEIDVAARKSRYSTNGLIGTTPVSTSPGNPINKKYSLRWKPITDLLLRASYGDTFRAPSVGDLYAGGSENFPAATDPCNNSLNAQGVANFDALPAAGQARCLAAGVPAGGLDQLNAQIRALAGGNPFLKPEHGKNFSAGFVYSPSYVTGLNLTVDYWRINLKDAIVLKGIQTFLNNCYYQDNAGSACTAIDRLPNGQISVVHTGQLNAASLFTDGWDFGLTYHHDIGNFGNLGIKWDTTLVRHNRQQDDQGNTFELVGEYTGAPNWKWRSIATLDWTKGDWDASWTMRYVSKQDESCGRYGALICNHPNDISSIDDISLNSDGSRTVGFNRMGATTYHDLQIGWKAPWKAHLAVGARNIFGKEPPISALAFASSFDASYDLPGGPFYYFQYRQDF